MDYNSPHRSVSRDREAAGVGSTRANNLQVYNKKTRELCVHMYTINGMRLIGVTVMRFIFHDIFSYILFDAENQNYSFGERTIKMTYLLKNNIFFLIDMSRLLNERGFFWLYSMGDCHGYLKIK